MKFLGAIILFLAGFTVPVEYVQFFSVGGLVVTPAKVATGLLVLYALALWGIGQRRPSRSTPTKHVMVLAFGFAAMLGFVISLMEDLPLSNLLRVGSTWFFLVIFYFTLGRALVTRANIDVFLSGIGIGGVFVTITGLLGIGFQTFSDEGTRIGGLGGNSNELALNLLVAIAIAGYFITSARAGRTRTLWLVAMPILIFGLISTLSRSGMLGLLLMGSLWMFRFRRFDTLKFAVPAVLVAIGLFALAPEVLVERLETMLPDKISSDSSIQSRLLNFPYALQAFASNPITGVGLLGSLNFIFTESHGVSGTNVIHNMFLQIAAELGLMGLIPLVSIVWITWRDCSRCWFVTRRSGGWRDPELRSLGLVAAFMQIAFVGVLLVGQFQPTHNQRGVWMLYAITPVIVSMVVNRIRALEASTSVDQPLGEPTPPALPEVAPAAAAVPARGS